MKKNFHGSWSLISDIVKGGIINSNMLIDYFYYPEKTSLRDEKFEEEFSLPLNLIRLAFRITAAFRLSHSLSKWCILIKMLLISNALLLNKNLHTLIISHRSIRQKNSSCFWSGSDLLKPSVSIFAVGVHLIVIFSFLISWINQWRWTSTCLSLMMYVDIGFDNTLIVCMLSHGIIEIWKSWNEISSKNLIHQINSFPVADVANNLVSIELIGTVFCLEAF